MTEGTADTADTANPVRLTRTFAATRDVVWRMWTDPAEFASWYGPDGATIEVTGWDLRPGGQRLVAMAMETPNGPMRMEFTGEFREVAEPERIAYTEATAGHPETLVEVELAEDGERTTLVLTHHGIPAGSPGEAGWRAAFDELDRRLTRP